MRYLNIYFVYIALQIVLILIVMGFSFGESVHISGSTKKLSKSTIAHISGSVFSENLSKVKTHVSGSDKALFNKEPILIKSKVRKKASNREILLRATKKSLANKIESKETEKNKKSSKASGGSEQLSLKERINKRKICWKVWENAWRVKLRKNCSTLLDSLRQECKKIYFKDRLICVRENCKGSTG